MFVCGNNDPSRPYSGVINGASIDIADLVMYLQSLLVTKDYSGISDLVSEP